jgi:hypothetical protein
MASEGAGHQRGYSELSSSANSSANPSRPGSAGDNRPSRRGRVRFNSISEANDAANKRSSVRLRDTPVSPTNEVPTPPNITSSPSSSRTNDSVNLLRQTPETEKENPFLDPILSPVLKPRPSVLRNSSYASDLEDEYDSNEKSQKTFSALAAQERAQRIASLVGSHSAPTSARTSLDGDGDDHVPLQPNMASHFPVRLDDIPLVDLDFKRPYDGEGYGSDEDAMGKGQCKGRISSSTEAHKLVRAHTRKQRLEGPLRPSGSVPALPSGQITPTEERAVEEYVPRPDQYRPGILSNLLKLYHDPGPGGSRAPSRRGSAESDGSPLTPGSAASSGATTPTSKHQKWYNQKNHSQDTLAGLVEASTMLGGVPPFAKRKGVVTKPVIGKRTQSGQRLINSAVSAFNGRPRIEDEIRITIHIAETLSRQKYLLKICRALMSYGAPNHRLEEYMKMSARVLEIDGQFLYIPGCMIISFDDASTHTTEVKLVKADQGVDLGKLKDAHEVYKEVVHDVIGVEEATQRLDVIMNAKPKFNVWLRVMLYGFASVAVAPFGKSQVF